MLSTFTKRIFVLSNATAIQNVGFQLKYPTTIMFIKEYAVYIFCIFTGRSVEYAYEIETLKSWIEISHCFQKKIEENKKKFKSDYIEIGDSYISVLEYSPSNIRFRGSNEEINNEIYAEVAKMDMGIKLVVTVSNNWIVDMLSIGFFLVALVLDFILVLKVFLMIKNSDNFIFEFVQLLIPFTILNSLTFFSWYITKSRATRALGKVITILGK